MLINPHQSLFIPFSQLVPSITPLSLIFMELFITLLSLIFMEPFITLLSLILAIQS